MYIAEAMGWRRIPRAFIIKKERKEKERKRDNWISDHNFCKS